MLIKGGTWKNSSKDGERVWQQRCGDLTVTSIVVRLVDGMMNPASALNFEKAIVACSPGISDGGFSLFSRTKPPIMTFPNLKPSLFPYAL
ncbi:hypothetical protein EV1_034198 [Malus domestica]